MRLRLPAYTLSLGLAAAACLGVWLAVGLRAWGVLGSPAEDLTDYFWHSRVYLGRALASGSLPWWTSQIYGGMPFLANPQNAGFYPPNWLFAVLPPGWVFNLLTLGHLWLGGVGAGVLARSRGISRWGCVLATITVTLAPGILARVYAGHVTMVACVAWFPWILWLAGSLWRVRNPVPTALALGGVVALAILAGYPQPLAYMMVLTGLWFVGLAPTVRRSDPGQVGGRVASRVAWFGGALALGLGLAAIQLLPMVEYLHESARQNLSTELRATYSLVPMHLLTTILPGRFGGVGGGDYWGVWNPWEMEVFLGHPVTLLAVLAVPACLMLDRRHRAYTAFLAGFAAVFVVLFSLGPATPLFALSGAVPVFDRFRAPVRMMALLPVFVGLLGGCSVDLLVRLVRRRPARLPLALRVLIPVAVGIAVASVCYRAGVLFPSEVRETALRRAPISDSYGILGKIADPAFAREATVTANAAAARGAAFLGLTTGLLAAAVFARRRWLTGSMVGLLAVQAIHAATEARGYAVVANPHPETWISAPPETQSRVLVDPLKFPVNDLLGTNHGSPMGYDPLFPRRFGEFQNALRRQPRQTPADPSRLPSPGKVTAFLGTTHVWTAQGAVALPPGYGAPRASLYDQVDWAPGEEEVWRQLATRWADLGDFEEYRARPILTGTAPEFMADPGPPSGRTALGTSLTLVASPLHSDRLEILLDLPSTGVLLLRDTFMTGWTATADGEPTEVWQANLMHRAVVLARPTRRVLWTYSPPGAGLGAAISGIALLLTAGLGWQGARGRRHL